MGWLAWERFTCEIDCATFPHECINSRLFLEMAHRLKQDGWSELGYQYVNIDDCWNEMQRDPNTQRLVANRTRFPESIGGVATKVHELGLKLGLYGDCGVKTCAGYPAQLKSDRNLSDNYFETDARAMAEWQVDSFKFDGCYIDPLQAEGVCPRMSTALNQTGRPVLLVCEWPLYLMHTHQEPDWKLAADSCNVWRYYEDIEDSWLSVLNTIDYSVHKQATIVKYHGPGHWFDPDQLVIGNFGLSVDQALAQMALWSIWSAPLYMSNDLRSIRDEFVQILKNEQLIHLNQDPMGVFGMMVHNVLGEDGEPRLQTFVKPVEPVKNNCPSFAVLYLNRGTLGGRVKMSYGLRELLTGRPELVYHAAKNQLAAYGAAALPTGGARIEPGQCLERLRGAAASSSGPTSPAAHWYKQDERAGQAAAHKPIEYTPFDLIGNGGPDEPLANRLSLEANLDLLVKINSVRTIKLIEFD